jgi:hypothetical protein
MYNRILDLSQYVFPVAMKQTCIDARKHARMMCLITTVLFSVTTVMRYKLSELAAHFAAKQIQESQVDQYMQRS